jgi:galactokinase/mevalonate kinase-like predicted kinase
MSYKLKVPARINILGNPSDANEGDYATISVAVDIFAHGIIEPGGGINIVQKDVTDTGLRTAHSMEFAVDDIPLPYNGTLDLIKGSINRLYRYSPEFRSKLQTKGFKISTWTEVPKQSGLGGSSLFVILTLGGLRALYDLDPNNHNDYILAELTQRVEAKELKITAGYADRYVPIFGGIAYLDYRGKLHQGILNEEPYTTYERLDPWVKEIPLIAICSGLKRDSGDVHRRMRPRFLEEHSSWVKNGGPMPKMVQFMRTAWETAWRGKIALLQDDWKIFGDLMNQNHAAVNDMMTYCGFTDGAGWANNLLIETALSNGAFGAKLTGKSWEITSQDAGLKHAQIYQPRIAKQGMIVEEIDSSERKE